MTITRALVGFGVGGLAVPFNILAELLQPSARGTFLMSIELFWTLGSIYTAAMAWSLLSSSPYGWRGLAVVCAAPVFLSILAGVWMPESPRWLLLQHRNDEAKAVLLRMAEMNGTRHKLPDDFTLFEGGETEKGEFNVKALFSTPYLRRTTLLLWVVWISFGLGYYGVILLITRVFQHTENDDNGSKECSFEYSDIFVSTLSELLGIAWAVFTIDRYGRRPTQGFFYALAGVACIVLGAPSSHGARVFFAFIARAGMMAGSCGTWVATPELYPTFVRSSGHSIANSIARVGAFMSPYLVESSLAVLFVGLVLGIVDGFAAIGAFLLPETLGKSLDDAGADPPPTVVRAVYGHPVAHGEDRHCPQVRGGSMASSERSSSLAYAAALESERGHDPEQ
uniref:Major facilitator superfamily (MFS) profile domain-containing protein n=1 Tax=Rhizochromulina marina TaxID=1034831 RepID=A0A7S2S4X9_9STRA